MYGTPDFEWGQIYFILFVFGYAPYRKSKKKGYSTPTMWKIPSLIAVLVTSACVVYFIRTLSFSSSKNVLRDVFTLLDSIGFPLTPFLAVTLNFYHGGTICFVINRISKLKQALSTVVTNDKTNQKDWRRLKIYLVLTSTWTILQNITCPAYYFEQYLSTFIAIVNTFTFLGDIKFIIFVFNIKHLFECINEGISSTADRPRNDQQQLIKRLTVLRNIHFDVCELISLIDKSFSIAVYVTTSMEFVGLVYGTFLTLLNLSEQSPDISTSLYWFIYLTAKLTAKLAIATRTTFKVSFKLKLVP